MAQDDIIISKDWYEFYVNCYIKLVKIHKLLSNEPFKRCYNKHGYDELWEELIDIYDFSNVQSCYEYEKLIKEINGTPKQTKR